MSYNGWTNYETWNVALWMDNDYPSYQFARSCKNFQEYRQGVEPLTGDGVSLYDPKLNIKELDEILQQEAQDHRDHLEEMAYEDSLEGY